MTKSLLVQKLLFFCKVLTCHTYFFFRKLSESKSRFEEYVLHMPLSRKVSGDGDLVEIKLELLVCFSIIFSFFFDALLLMLINEFII